MTSRWKWTNRGSLRMTEPYLVSSSLPLGSVRSMRELLSVLFGFTFTVVFTLSLGLLFLQRFPLPLRRQERWPVAFALGAALLSGVTFVLCAIHVVYWWTVLLLGLAVIGFAWRS